MSLLLDAGCISAAFLIHLLYNVILVLMACHCPYKVRHCLNQAARRAWTLEVIRTRRDILAVQTVRNSMMAATLLASTSLTLSSLVAAYLYRLGDDAGLWNLGRRTDRGPIHPVLKMFILLCSFMVSFFSFMQSLRSASTASFLIGLPEGLPECCPERTADIVQRSALFYSIGSRAFVFSFVLLLWIFGAPAALVGAVVVVAVQAFNDYVMDLHYYSGHSSNDNSDCGRLARDAEC